MKPPDPLALAHALRDIAREAAEVLMTGYRTGVAVERKGAIDLVTAFDRASEDVIRRRVREALPELDLVAEEGGGTVSGARPVLYADPLDGTTNFAHGHPFFAVSLGVVDGDVLLAGAVDAPALGCVWWGARGHGAFRNGARCGVSRTSVLRDALLATGFPYDNATSAQPNFTEFAALTRASRGVRRCGAASLDLCLVADGTYDGYWERFLKPWDLAAGALLVREAGGVCSDLDGGPADVLSGRLVATNGALHAALLSSLADAVQSAAP